MKISAAAIRACIDGDVPLVVTLSDYWAICPNGTLLRNNDSLCRGPRHPLDCLSCTRRLHGFPRLPVSIKKILCCLKDIRAIARRNRCLRQMLLRADAIVALSPFQKGLLEANGYPAQRVLVNRHGICPRHLQGFSRFRREGVLRVGIVASPVRHKGVQLLLQALPRIPDAPVELLLYLGTYLPPTPFADELQQLVQTDQRVRLMGGFHPDDFGHILSGFDVLAVPSIWYENEPFVVKAALYCGVPVMVTDLPPLNSLVAPGRNGWLVAPDPAAWAEALIAAVECSQLPEAAGSWTQDMKTNTQYYENLYKDIL